MGRLQVVKRGTVPGPPGPPGSQGPPGLSGGSAFQPEQFAVDPDDLSDFYHPNDSAYAIQAAINAAATAGGGVVQLAAGKNYGIRGDIVQKNGVALHGAGANAYGNGSTSRITCLDSTGRYKWGSATLGGANFPAEIRDVIVDGANVAGAGHEVFRCEAVDSTLANVQVLNSAGDGAVFFNAQNCLIENLRVDNCPVGSAVKIQNNDEILINGQASGHLVFNGGHFTRSYRLLHVDYEDVSGGVLNFWPHDNQFWGTIFEQYQDDADLLIKLSDGETRFHGCTITGSSGLLTSVSNCVVLVENQKRPTLPTYATFDSCDFGGGAVGVDNLVRSNSYGVTNAIRIYGKTSVANANRGFFLCDDRAGGGLGVTGGVFGSIDGLIVDDSQLAVLGAATSANTFAVTSGWSDLTVGQKVHVIDVETGTYLAQLRTITALPTSPNRVTIDGAPITTTAGDYLMRIGVRLSTGINGGLGGVFKTTLRQPIGFEMDATQGNALQVKRKGDSFNRWQMDRDGTQRYLDPATGATIGAIIRAGALFGTTGRFGVGGSFYRSPVVSVLSADGAVSINWEATSSHVIAFTANGADATSITLTSTTVGATPADGQELLLWISGTGTNAITWTGSGITFDGTAPQPINGLVQFVEIIYRAGIGWFEKNRSHGSGAPGADGDSAYEIAVANGFSGTEAEWLESLEGLPGPVGPAGPTMPIGSPSVVSPDAGATVAVTPQGSVIWKVFLSGNITLTATDLHPGQFLHVSLQQSSTGGATVTLDTSWGGRTEAAASMSTSANNVDTLIVWNDGFGTWVKHVMSGVVPPAFTPMALTNQHDWFTADSLPASAEDAEILAWDNTYASGADMTAPGGAGTGPTLRVLNGMKYLEFNGSSDYLESAFSSISPPFTIAMVVRVNETSGVVPVVNGPSAGNTAVSTDGTSPRYWQVNSSGNTQTATGDWETIVIHVKNDGTGYLRRDGSQTTVNTGGAALVGLRIARQVALSTNYGQIDLRELIVLTKTPAGTDVADIENYLNKKRDQLKGL